MGYQGCPVYGRRRGGSDAVGLGRQGRGESQGSTEYSLFHQLLAPLTSCLVRGTTAGSGYASTSAAVHRCLLVHTNTGGALVILFTHNGGALMTLFTYIHLRTAGIVDT